MAADSSRSTAVGRHFKLPKCGFARITVGRIKLEDVDGSDETCSQLLKRNGYCCELNRDMCITLNGCADLLLLVAISEVTQPSCAR